MMDNFQVSSSTFSPFSLMCCERPSARSARLFHLSSKSEEMMICTVEALTWTCFIIMQRKLRFSLHFFVFFSENTLHQLVGIIACLMLCEVVDVDTQICSLKTVSDHLLVRLYIMFPAACVVCLNYWHLGWLRRAHEEDVLGLVIWTACPRSPCSFVLNGLQISHFAFPPKPLSLLFSISIKPFLKYISSCTVCVCVCLFRLGAQFSPKANTYLHSYR